MAGLYRGKVQNDCTITYMQGKKYPTATEKVYPNQNVSNNQLLKNPYNTLNEPIAKVGLRPERVTNDYWGNIYAYSSELLVPNVTNAILLKNPNNNLSEIAPEKKVLSRQQINDINNKLLPDFMLKNSGVTELAMKFLMLITDKRIKLITIGIMKLLVTKKSGHAFLERDRQKLLQALSIYDQSMTRARMVHQNVGNDETRLTQGLSPIVMLYEQQIGMLFRLLITSQDTSNMDNLISQALSELATLSNALTRMFEQNNNISSSSTLSSQQILEAGNIDPTFTVPPPNLSGSGSGNIVIVNGQQVPVKRPQAGSIVVPPANNEGDFETLANLGLDLKGLFSKKADAIPDPFKGVSEEAFQEAWEQPRQPTPIEPPYPVTLSKGMIDEGKGLVMLLAELLRQVAQIKSMPIFTNIAGDSNKFKFLNASKIIHGDALTILNKARERVPVNPVSDIEMQDTKDNVEQYVTYLNEIINNLSSILDIQTDNIEITARQSVHNEIQRVRTRNLILSPIVKSTQQLLSGIEGLSQQQLALAIKQQASLEQKSDLGEIPRQVFVMFVRILSRFATEHNKTEKFWVAFDADLKETLKGAPPDDVQFFLSMKNVLKDTLTPAFLKQKMAEQNKMGQPFGAFFNTQNILSILKQKGIQIGQGKKSSKSPKSTKKVKTSFKIRQDILDILNS